MRLIETISRAIDQEVGTLVMRQSTACEVMVSHKMFRWFHTDGYCVPRETIADFIATMLSGPAGSTSAVTGACASIAKADLEGDPYIRHIIVLSDKLTFPTSGLIERAVIHRSLMNHERFHSITMIRPKAWAEMMHELMLSSSSISNQVLVVADELMKIDSYKNMLHMCTKEWIIATEILGRVAAINHAPEKYRELVASYQLNDAKEELLHISNDIRSRWRTTEGFVGWCDAIYYGSLI